MLLKPFVDALLVEHVLAGELVDLRALFNNFGTDGTFDFFLPFLELYNFEAVHLFFCHSFSSRDTQCTKTLR